MGGMRDLLLPSFALRSSGGLSEPWPRGGVVPFLYGKVGLNHTSGRFRGFASCSVVRGFEVVVCVGDVEVEVGCATAAAGLAARAKKDLDRRPVAKVKAWLEEAEEEEEEVVRRRSREDDADIGLGCLHECDSVVVCEGGEGCRRVGRREAKRWTGVFGWSTAVGFFFLGGVEQQTIW